MFACLAPPCALPLWLLTSLANQICEETYLMIVRNKILIDVQGEDILMQIFTGLVLQREPGREAPFLEFIQRLCADPGRKHRAAAAAAGSSSSSSSSKADEPAKKRAKTTTITNNPPSTANRCLQTSLRS